MPADSFCLVDNSVIEMEREGKAGGVVKKHSMKGEIEKKLRGEGGQSRELKEGAGGTERG